MKKRAPRYKKPPLIPISIIRFHRRTLSLFKKVRLFILLLIMLLSGILGLISPLTWIWVISFISFAIGLYDFYSDFFAKPNLQMLESHEVQNLCKSLKPSIHEEKYGYKNISIPFRNDSIIMSQKVNHFLRYNSDKIKLKLKSGEAHRLLNHWRQHSDFFRDALVCQYFRARSRGSMFFNDKKISLLSSIDSETKSVKLFESCYYLSFLTNDLATLDIEDHSNKNQPESVWSAIDNFPYSEGRNFAPDRIKELHCSKMSNHIGGNTIAFTQDRRMILWRQNKSAMRSVGLLAPSGSGSLDFPDYTDSAIKNLLSLAVRGMERELLEECHPEGGNITDFIEVTKVIGFYRWVGKAGLPGFLGISKLNVAQGEIVPNSSEVDNPSKVQTDYPAETLEQLTKSIQELKKMPNLSVPLAANLLAIEGIIKYDPDFLDFIFE